MNLNEYFEINNNRYHYSEVIQVLREKLSAQRIDKIDKITPLRIPHIYTVMEKIHDIGNVNAVMRSAESLGFYWLRIIESQEKMKYSTRISQGSYKWLDIERFQNAPSCLQDLKDRGVQIISTHLSQNAMPIEEIDFSKPSAIVFGNERDGVSDEILKQSDFNCLLPSYGFTQSYNISVAAAMALYHIRSRLLLQSKKFSFDEIERIKARYMLASCKSPHLYFK